MVYIVDGGKSKKCICGKTHMNLKVDTLWYKTMRRNRWCASTFACSGLRVDEFAHNDSLQHPVLNVLVSSLILRRLGALSQQLHKHRDVPVTSSCLRKDDEAQKESSRAIPGVADSAVCILFGCLSAQQSPPTARSRPFLAPGESETAFLAHCIFNDSSSHLSN